MARTIAVVAVMLMCVVAVSAARQAPGRYLADIPSIAPAPYAWAPDSSAPEGAPVSSPLGESPAWAPAWAPAWESASAPAPDAATPPPPASAPPSDGTTTPASAPAPIRGY